jgi:cellulose synthase/poly-beta-1,6-N-acetylglucosamine synthase-like glycosyltransferase
VLILASVAILCSAVYALAGIAAAYGILRLPRARELSDAELPAVSVLVSARNEARDLPACIECLTALDYPRDRLEILLVDDRSTDGTAGVIARAAEQFPYVRGYGTADFDTHLEAKSRGIALAAAHARGDWLFITDADALVHPRWLRSMLGRADPDVALLAGNFVTEPSSWVGWLERATVLPANSIALGADGLGADVVPMGPNMAIRRDVYEAQGGFAAVNFKIADDIALWQLGRRAGMRVRAVLEPEATVFTRPVPSLVHLISQQRRWLVGGFGDGPQHIRWASVGVAAWAMVGTSSVIIACALGLRAGLIGAGLLGLSQLASMTAIRLRLQLRSVWRFLPLSLAYTSALFVWLPLTAFLLPRVRWRGEGYEVRFTD